MRSGFRAVGERASPFGGMLAAAEDGHAITATASSTRLRFAGEPLRRWQDVLRFGVLIQASGAQTMQALIRAYLGAVSDGPGTIWTWRGLFVSRANSARSQIAEALLRKHAGARFEAYSAGIDPGEINPLTIRVLNETGIDASGLWAKSVELFRGKMYFDYVITVCSNAEARCPAFPAATARLHWPVDDPAIASGSEEERLVRFRMVRDEIERHILAWLQEVR
jgi:arsenate reductase